MPRFSPRWGPATGHRILAAVVLVWAGCIIEAQEFDFPILLPKWINDFSLRTGAGYRDNVGLSARSPQDSAFIVSGLEMILLRLPENGTQFNFFASAEDLHFLSSSVVDREHTAFGDPLPDTRRKSIQQEARLAWKHHWDANNRWRTTTRLSARQSEDNGSGYFDYTKLQAGEQFLFHTKNWDISAEAKVARYDYPFQTVSATDLAKRRSTELAFNFRCERRVASFFRIFA